ncbi:MAG: cytochrome P450 [Vicinamibacterales bacterium]
MSDPFPGPLSPEVRENPYPCYRWLLAERPVYHDPQEDYWAISRYADVVAASRNYVVFSSGQGIGEVRDRRPTVVSTDPPEHTRLRRLVNQAFSPSVIEAMRPRVEQLCHQLIDTAIVAGSFDLVKDLAVPLPVIVIADMLGFEPKRYRDALRWSDGLVAVFSNPDTGKALDLYSRTSPQFFFYIGDLINRRRHDPGDDLISLMLDEDENGDRLTAKEIAYSCELFLAAGNETTAGLIGNAALALAGHPDQAREVRDTPSLIPRLVEEAIRYDGPTQALFRTTTTAVSLHGVEIPAGAKIALMWGAANRDPEVFPEPDSFIAARDPNPHLGFGHGVHHCIGAPLARLESSVVAKVLIERFSRLSPDPRRPPIRRLSSSIFRKLESFPMSYELR